MGTDGRKGKPPLEKFHFDNLYWKDPRRFGPLLLYQVGDMGCEGGFVLEDHRQRCYEISYIVSGEGIYSTDGAARNVKKGDVYLSRPDEVHGIRADLLNPFRYFYLGFDVDAGQAGESSKLFSIVSRFVGLTNPCVSDLFNIRALFLGIFNELMNQDEFSDIVMEDYLRQILVLAYRDFIHAGAIAYRPQSEMENAKKIVYEIIHYLEANLLKIDELTQVCEALGYSYPYLSHVFRHETGESIQDCYNRLRFEAAADQLKNSSSSVTDIADNLKYQSIHTFSRAFRQFFGMSPSEYRESSRKPGAGNQE